MLPRGYLSFVIGHLSLGEVRPSLASPGWAVLLAAAFYQFHVFPPVVYLPWVSGWARKRNASTQLILVELKGDADRDRFLELCCENPHVLKIEEISEDEFTEAPSHAI
jgi:hypothetical protein